MYKLHDNPILLEHQQTILREFFASPPTRAFFLTGGTALSAFYFAHRESRDFDLFSIEDFSFAQIDSVIAEIAHNMNAIVSVAVQSQTYKELYLRNDAKGWTQRIDIVREQPKRFGNVELVDGVRVDTVENIGSNKILTIFSRLEPKDYIDLYTILTKTSWTFDKLFDLAKQKDTDLSEFYFAHSVANIEKITSWPPLVAPLDIAAMVAYFRNLSEKLLLRVKPEK